MNLLRSLSLALILGLSSCSGSSREVVVVPNGGDDCTAACVQARAVCAQQSCPADVLRLSSETPDGQACETWRCRQGYPHEHNQCLARATTPSELQACKGVGKLPGSYREAIGLRSRQGKLRALAALGFSRGFCDLCPRHGVGHRNPDHVRLSLSFEQRSEIDSPVHHAATVRQHSCQRVMRTNEDRTTQDHRRREAQGLLVNDEVVIQHDSPLEPRCHRSQ